MEVALDLRDAEETDEEEETTELDLTEEETDDDLTLRTEEEDVDEFCTDDDCCCVCCVFCCTCCCRTELTPGPSMTSTEALCFASCCAWTRSSILTPSTSEDLASAIFAIAYSDSDILEILRPSAVVSTLDCQCSKSSTEGGNRKALGHNFVNFRKGAVDG